uniref:Uncharacterized protein n=1 Tax=Arundo donax TaxID=35708 RepID=A0A0A9E4A6_ARUDO
MLLFVRLLPTVGPKANAEGRRGGFRLPMLRGAKTSPRIKFSPKHKLLTGHIACCFPLQYLLVANVSCAADRSLVLLGHGFEGAASLSLMTGWILVSCISYILLTFV